MHLSRIITKPQASARIIATWAGVGLALVAMPVAAQTQTPANVRVVEPGESIQTAINASQPGTHIRVKAGTYAEQLVITRDRTWLDGDAGARLVPPATLVANGCTGMVVLGRVATSPPAHAGICVIGDVTFGAWDGDFFHKPVTATKRAVTGVTISGLDVEGFSVGIALAGTLTQSSSEPASYRVVRSRSSRVPPPTPPSAATR